MGLFGNKKTALPPLMTEADFDEVADYSSTIAYLEGLSAEEYAKVLQVTNIRRKANDECGAVLGEVKEPTTFIKSPEPKQTDFLEEIAPTEPKRIEVQ